MVHSAVWSRPKHKAMRLAGDWCLVHQCQQTAWFQHNYTHTVLQYNITTVLHAATAHKNYISTCLEWHYETWHFIYCAWLESHSQKWSCQNQTQDVLSIGYTRPGTGLSSKVSEDHYSSYIGYKKQLYFAACAIKIVSHTSVFWELLATCKTAKLAQHNLNKNNAIITTMTISVHCY